jgi:hypothetical protein
MTTVHTRPLEAILSIPGADKLRKIPGMQAVLAKPISVDCVAAVAAAAALGVLDDWAIHLKPRITADENEKNNRGIILSIPEITKAFRELHL